MVKVTMAGGDSYEAETVETVGAVTKIGAPHNIDVQSSAVVAIDNLPDKTPNTLEESQPSTGGEN